MTSFGPSVARARQFPVPPCRFPESHNERVKRINFWCTLTPLGNSISRERRGPGRGKIGAGGARNEGNDVDEARSAVRQREEIDRKAVSRVTLRGTVCTTTQGEGNSEER